MSDSTFGSPRLPADPPAELDDYKRAQEIWIETISNNPQIRDLDFDCLVEYCILLEQLEGLERLDESENRGVEDLGRCKREKIELIERLRKELLIGDE